MKKIEQSSTAWIRSMAILAETYVNVVACGRCGAANAEGYVCIRCGWDGSPSEISEEEK
jgi:hypothetical protein